MNDVNWPTQELHLECITLESNSQPLAVNHFSSYSMTCWGFYDFPLLWWASILLVKKTLWWLQWQKIIWGCFQNEHTVLTLALPSGIFWQTDIKGPADSTLGTWTGGFKFDSPYASSRSIQQLVISTQHRYSGFREGPFPVKKRGYWDIRWDLKMEAWERVPFPLHLNVYKLTCVQQVFPRKRRWLRNNSSCWSWLL